MFQTVCLDSLRHLIMAVRCVPHQLHTYLLSQPLSSHARQAVVTEEPFTSKTVVVVNAFCMRYVAMIVAQHTQVAIRITSLRTLK